LNLTKQPGNVKGKNLPSLKVFFIIQAAMFFSYIMTAYAHKDELTGLEGRAIKAAFAKRRGSPPEPPFSAIFERPHPFPF
jgi:hypothetical protein